MARDVNGDQEVARGRKRQRALEENSDDSEQEQEAERVDNIWADFVKFLDDPARTRFFHMLRYILDAGL